MITLTLTTIKCYYLFQEQILSSIESIELNWVKMVIQIRNNYVVTTKRNGTV